MRVLNREDYEKLARQVVTEFVENSVPLTDSLVKVSDSMGLNPDQIKSLVSVANTLTHLDLFDRKDGDDKVVEFEPADPKAVLSRVYNGEKLDAVKQELAPDACDMFGEFPDMLAEKEEAPAEEAPPEEEAISPRRQQITIIKIRKVAEELKQRKLAAALNYEEEINKLAADFASLYGPNFDNFEKDAIDVHGGDAIPILADLRKLLRKPDIKLAVFEKSARLVDSDTREMKSFGQLKTLAEEAKACAAGLQLLEQKVGGVL
jgi:hypothetical protein